MTSPASDPGLLAKIRQKQKERQESFLELHKQHGPFDEIAQSILRLPVEELLTNLKCRKVSARQVLRAYTLKALKVTEKYNCVTEFIPQALDWASALDAISPVDSSNISPLPLHGLPVAIKEDHDVEGMDTTLGFAKNLYKPVKESAVLVKILLKLGAVPFVKTNVPQSLLSNGSDNPIFGTTLNCLNVDLAPGGSSSGSACLIAAGGAPFATGSDLGGSLRTPAHFHGICSMRPTARRLSEKGVMQCLPESTILRGVPGIMAADAKVLALVWKSITELGLQNQFDPLTVPVPWNENLFASAGKKLKIGYYDSLSFFPSFKDTKNAILAAKTAFESQGHTVVEFEMPDEFHYLKVFCDLLMADHGKYLEEMFSGEPVSNCVADLLESIRNWKSLVANNDIENMTRRDKIVSGCGVDVKTAGDLWNLAHEKQVITRDIANRMEKVGIDLILCPAFPFPAVKFDEGYRLLAGFVYTSIWNLIDFPAGVVPFGTETGSDVELYEDHNEPMLTAAKLAMSDSARMPINVQIVALPFKEELVLRAMVALEAMRPCQNEQTV